MIQGTEQELQFWEVFVKTDRFLKDWCSNTKTSELDQDVADFIVKNCPADGSILDCGSGVVSVLHGLMPGVELVATDLLANDYEKIFDYDKHGLLIPYGIAAENLPKDWHDEFDIVHMRNALDHTQDPVKAYNSMFVCVKPGGYLIIQGFENEATFENWKGMHQWNIGIQEKQISTGKCTPDMKFAELYVKDKSGRVNNLGLNPIYYKQFKLNTGKDWFVWITKKESNGN
jgi:SAM-dependent methyltransferase